MMYKLRPITREIVYTINPRDCAYNSGDDGLGRTLTHYQLHHAGEFPESIDWYGSLSRKPESEQDVGIQA